MTFHQPDAASELYLSCELDHDSPRVAKRPAEGAGMRALGTATTKCPKRANLLLEADVERSEARQHY